MLDSEDDNKSEGDTSNEVDSDAGGGGGGAILKIPISCLPRPEEMSTTLGGSVRVVRFVMD